MRTDASMPSDIAPGAPYGLPRPSVTDLRTCVTRSSGDDPQLWSQLCQAADVDTDTDDPAALVPLVAAALKVTTGTARVAVMSFDIRLRAHSALTAVLATAV